MVHHTIMDFLTNPVIIIIVITALILLIKLSRLRREAIWRKIESIERYFANHCVEFVGWFEGRNPTNGILPNKPLQLTAGISGFMSVFWFAARFRFVERHSANPPLCSSENRTTELCS